MAISEAHCYATRLLNPYQGVVQITKTDQAWAVSLDETLINKILVEAVMRKAAVKS